MDGDGGGISMAVTAAPAGFTLSQATLDLAQRVQEENRAFLGRLLLTTTMTTCCCANSQVCLPPTIVLLADGGGRRCQDGVVRRSGLHRG